jgi:beta-phosphoglucomutase
MIKGVLFDMDGVLVDSEAFMCKASIMMFDELGIKVLPEDFQPFVGMGENKYLGGVAEHYGLKINLAEAKVRAYEIFEIIVQGNLIPLPGAHELIAECRKKGFKLALATSADNVKMNINLKEIRLSPESFDSIITGQDIVNKKPFPDIYIKAAKSLGLEPDECLVVEDAISGIIASKSAGCRCLAVTNSFEASALLEADWICDSLLSVPENALNW